VKRAGAKSSRAAADRQQAAKERVGRRWAAGYDWASACGVETGRRWAAKERDGPLHCTSCITTTQVALTFSEMPCQFRGKMKNATHQEKLSWHRSFRPTQKNQSDTGENS
jgi:hypothetical protein